MSYINNGESALSIRNKMNQGLLTPATVNKSGSVLNITAPEDSKYIYFTAPSDYSPTDTYRINGVGYTLKSQSNENVGFGWKNGAKVILFLDNNVAYYNEGGASKEYIDSNISAIIRSYPVASGHTVKKGDVVDVIDGKIYGNLVSISELSEGDSFYLNENSKPELFVVLKHNYQSDLNTNRTLVMRYNKYDTLIQWNANNINAYNGSTIDTWLNGTYKNLFDANTKNAMSTTKIYYTPGNNNNSVTTISKSIFLLSYGEFKGSNKYCNTEGEYIPFAGVFTTCTRTPCVGEHAGTTLIMPAYNVYEPQYRVQANQTFNPSPAFTLPTTFLVKPGNSIRKDAIALKDGNAGSTVEVVYYGIVNFDSIKRNEEISSNGVHGYGILDGIMNVNDFGRVVYGSYIGDGSYGSGNPTSLTFPSPPKFLLIQPSKFGKVGADLTFYLSIISSGFLFNDSSPGSSGTSWIKYAILSIDGNTVSWYQTNYNTNTSQAQANVLGVEYEYLAIL